MLKEVIIFASGCAIGAAIAVPITINKVAKREQDRADAKTKSKDAYIEELEAKIKAHNMALNKNYIQKESEKEEKLVESRGVKDKKVEKKVVLCPPVRDYTVYYQDKAENEYPTEEDYEEKRVVDYEKGPKVVSNEEYWSPEYEYHDKCELNYFVEDEVLADSGNEVVEKEEILIGNAIRDSGFNKNNEKVLYVRNYELSTDYEIAKVFGAYSEYV